MLSAKNAGLAGGILWGAMMLLSTLLSVATGWGASFFTMIASVYPGYSVSYLGAVIGAVYGFVDGFICLWLLVLLYNKLGGD